jgi:hypothetical protein
MHEPRAKNLETLGDHKHSYADSFIPSEALLSSLSLHLHLLWDNLHEGARADSCQKGRRTMAQAPGLGWCLLVSRSLPESRARQFVILPLPEFAPIFRDRMMVTRGQTRAESFAIAFLPIARPLVAVCARYDRSTQLSFRRHWSSPIENLSRILRQFLGYIVNTDYVRDRNRQCLSGI